MEEKGMSENKRYENAYKVQAVKLAKKIGAVKAANELQIPVNMLYGWIRKVKIGSLDIGCGERSPEESLRTCLHKKYMWIFEHNFVADKAKIRRRSVTRQVFFTQDAAKFAEKTRIYACEDRFLFPNSICLDLAANHCFRVISVHGRIISSL